MDAHKLLKNALVHEDIKNLLVQQQKGKEKGTTIKHHQPGRRAAEHLLGALASYNDKPVVLQVYDKSL
jgi:hypothetical protein